MKQLTDYTLDELRNIPAGVEADALVEASIFGAPVIQSQDTTPLMRNMRGTLTKYDDIPSYSTSIADAWRVVEHLKHMEPAIYVFENRTHLILYEFDDVGLGGIIADCQAPTAPLAIVRAALVAVWMDG